MLSGVVWPRFFGRRHLGAISGVAMSVQVVASGLGPVLFAAAIELTGDYRIVFALGGLVPLLLAISALGTQNPQRALARTEGPGEGDARP
jgi:MFS family permease